VARVSFGPVAAGRVRDWLADGDFDVVHIHEPATPSLSVLALWAARAPVVATFHTAQRRSRALEASAATFLRPGLGKIAGHIAVSGEARRTMARYLDRVDPVVIPNGVDTGRFSGPPTARGAGGAAEPRLLFVGRVDEPRKGLAVLLDALPAVVAAYPAARLVVVGHGAGRSLLRALPPAVAARVDLRGPLDERGKVAELARADALVAPNTHGESFGVVLVEAMAAGTPVVASDLPAFRRILGDGERGRLVRAGDSAALAAGLVGLLGDGAGTRLRARRARAAAAGFDWSAVAPRVVSVYADAAGCPPPASRRAGPHPPAGGSAGPPPPRRIGGIHPLRAARRPGSPAREDGREQP